MAETNTAAQAPEKKSWLTRLFGFDGSKMKVSTAFQGSVRLEQLIH